MLNSSINMSCITPTTWSLSPGDQATLAVARHVHKPLSCAGLLLDSAFSFSLDRQATQSYLKFICDSSYSVNCERYQLVASLKKAVANNIYDG